MSIKGSTDKFVYITGCDTGFGNILTKKLDQLGFSVIPGVYLEKSATDLKSQCSKNVHPVQVDVSNEKSVEKAAAQITEIVKNGNGILHAVVNNAGILVQPGPVEWTPNDAYRSMFNVNVMGTVMTTKSLLPLLRASQGRIVNVASIAGRIGLPTEPAYCMSKYAVEGYSEVLRKDLLAWGITVHIVEPGIFSKTGLYDRFQTGLDGLWESLDDNLKQVYGENFYKAVRKGMGDALIHEGNTNSELVPIAMIHAITSNKPQYRYKVGTDSKYIISIIEKCHESTQDWLLTRSEDKPNAVRPTAAPKDARKNAIARYEKNWPRFILALLAVLFLLRKAKM